MMNPWMTFFWLIIIFLILLVFNRWITAHVQGVGLLLTGSQTGAIWLYFFIFLPGIFIHELSHFLVAKLLGVHVSNFTLWPQMTPRGELILGSVEVRGADPLRHSLVGAAPLFFGCGAIVLIGKALGFDEMGLALSQGRLADTIFLMGDSFTTPDFWLWLYLLFAIANAMLPSPADRVYWLPVLLFFGAIVIIAIALDIVTAVPELVETASVNFITFMISALAMAVAVDIIFIIFIFLLEGLLNLVTNRKVQY